MLQYHYQMGQVLHSVFETATLVRPYKNKPMNLGYVLWLEKVNISIIQDDFLAGKISLQESMRRKEEVDRVTKDLLDELDIRQRGSIYKDNSAKARAERKEYSRKLQNMSLPERVFKWAAESLRSFVSSNEK